MYKNKISNIFNFYNQNKIINPTESVDFDMSNSTKSVELAIQINPTNSSIINKPVIQTENITECNICFEIINPKSSIKLNCNKYSDHVLCKKCYKNLMLNKIYKCPTCRNDIKNLPYLIQISNYKYLKQLIIFVISLIIIICVGLLLYGLNYLLDEFKKMMDRIE